MPSSPTNALAQCIIDWLYEQAAEILEIIKNFILGLIAQIDAFVAFLRACLAQWDVLAKAEEAAWQVIQKVIDEIRNALMTIPDGPLAEKCPSFYEALLQPALDIFEAAVAMLTMVREKFKNTVSFMDEVDMLIAYWETTKALLIMILEMADDALIIARSKAGEVVP